jgi:UDP-N-acetylmuramate--alanine ligase
MWTYIYLFLIKGDSMRKHVHFIGIGGVSMSGLAEILIHRGFKVTGSDSRASEITDRLKTLGIDVYIGHSKDNVSKCDLVVYTAAVKDDNPEIIMAKENGIRLMDRASLLGSLMREFSCPICVAGTHGKTSTTSMITEILLKADMNPTVSVGGYLNSISGYFRMGGTEYFVVESCEYCDSFLKFSPKVAVILNIDRDHLDYFSDLGSITDSFRRFAEKVPADGALVVSEHVPQRVWGNLHCKVITYGTENADVTARNISFDDAGFPSFVLVDKGIDIGRVELKIHGRHNVLNALAAYCASKAASAEPLDILAGLEDYQGVRRRFEEKGRFNGARVIDDYAHHPAEIQATISAAALLNHNRIFVVFQPHTYSRTLALLDEFAIAFKGAYKVLVLDIYAAREKNTGLIHARDLAGKIKEAGTDAVYFPDIELARNFLLENCITNDLCITLGAGDVYLLGESLVKQELCTVSTKL